MNERSVRRVLFIYVKMHQLAFITKTQFPEKDGLSKLGSLTFILLSMCDVFATVCNA